jgi:hypothetical protein
VSSVTDVVGKPTEESIRAAFAEAEEESAFWREHYAAYVTEYPDQFVAVARADGQVVAANVSLDFLLGYIAGKGLDPRQLWVQFIAATPLHVRL